ncbi:MAG: enoyl-CoA hydratase/isomerase family protein [Pseudolabrys sp.]|nr:enoyl-CoA hydratase/isomerase family protein [Pseudolabrys sp.]
MRVTLAQALIRKRCGRLRRVATECADALVRRGFKEFQAMNEGEVRVVREGVVATILFDRPQARNAMTWAMYEGLAAACAQLATDDSARAVVLRGVGHKAFIAGTDIAQFQAFTDGEDGIAYEARMEDYLTALEKLPMPTLAVVEGWAIGGGLAIAACCDLRIATPGSKFGVPIARTLGNCLSVANYARLVAGLGEARAKRMLLMAENVPAEDALAAGFLMSVVDPAGLDAAITEICERLAGNAPVTMRVTKESMRRLRMANLPDGDDLVRAAYGSDDFHEGVAAFVAKRPAQWKGR